VTGLALLAKAVLMNIILFMAGNTGRWCLAAWLVRFVATAAGGTLVCSAQFKIGLIVVKRLLYQACNIGITAQVVAVTLTALTGAVCFQTAMETGIVLQVFGYGLVAIEAKGVLHFAIKAAMATAAFVFNIGVGADHLPRHDQGLNTGCL
jgi:hypothetical protein